MKITQKISKKIQENMQNRKKLFKTPLKRFKISKKRLRLETKYIRKTRARIKTKDVRLKLDQAIDQKFLQIIDETHKSVSISSDNFSFYEDDNLAFLNEPKSSYDLTNTFSQVSSSFFGETSIIFDISNNGKSLSGKSKNSLQ